MIETEYANSSPVTESPDPAPPRLVNQPHTQPFPASTSSDGCCEFVGRTLRIRKQIYELRIADLQAVPVWELAVDEEGVDGQDECTVRPCRLSPPIDGSRGMFVVRAAFTLADGTSAMGYVTPPGHDDDDISSIQPVIVTDDGQIMFWWGILEPQRDWIESAYRLLGRGASDVFPIHYLSDVDAATGPISGDINGFMQLDDDGSINTVM